jgi:Mg-chelatase subunit ChlD
VTSHVSADLVAVPLLWVVPLALALVFWLDRRARGALRRLVGERGDVSLLAQVRPRGRMWAGGLRALAIGLLVVGAARPEWGREVVRRAASGSDVVLVVDVSASMDVRDSGAQSTHEARRGRRRCSIVWAEAA